MSILCQRPWLDWSLCPLHCLLWCISWQRGPQWYIIINFHVFSVICLKIRHFLFFPRYLPKNPAFSQNVPLSAKILHFPKIVRYLHKKANATTRDFSQFSNVVSKWAGHANPQSSKHASVFEALGWKSSKTCMFSTLFDGFEALVGPSRAQAGGV